MARGRVGELHQVTRLSDMNATSIALPNKVSLKDAAVHFQSQPASRMPCVKPASQTHVSSPIRNLHPLRPRLDGPLRIACQRCVGLHVSQARTIFRRNPPAIHAKPMNPSAIALDQLPDLQPATVLGVSAPAHAAEWRQWLEEIGFLPGERVAVMVRGVPGGDPLVVRIGTSTFALRRAEAACVQVSLDGEAA